MRRATTIEVEQDLVGTAALAELSRWGRMPLRRGKSVILDMRHVHAVDATGIAALVRLQSALHRSGAQLELVAIDDDVRALLVEIGALNAFHVAS